MLVKLQKGQGLHLSSRTILKNILKATVIFSFLTSPLAYSEMFEGPSHFSSKTFNNLIINGPAVLTEVKADSLMVHGTTTFRQLQVENKTNFKGATRGEEGKFKNVSVYGSFQVKKLSCDSLNVLGSVSLNEFVINGPTTITGALNAKNGQFQDITLESSDVHLENVKVNSILIKQERKQKTVFLEGNTVIAGDITFESGVGSVVVKGSNVKIEGKINGGQIKDGKNVDGKNNKAKS